ncbi:MAG: alpha/beta fold hydrolase [Proteobacteria bacterium]|nr:alpha/beta fold hydrolase [Pseudomonadota bacterium]
MVNFRREHYPFVGHFLDRDGVAMHYLDEGSGEAVVMLHGNPTWSFYYRRLVLGLRAQCRIIVPDHIGCGFSDKPDDAHYEFTLERRVQDLDALIKHLNLPPKITLVLHDWGGMIGMTWAARNPHRIARLVLLNTAAFHLPKTKKLPPSLWVCRNTPLDALLVRKTGLFVRLVTRWGVRTRVLSPSERDAYLTPHAAKASRLAQLRFVQDIPLTPDHPTYALISDVQAKLGQFRATPTLICWGDQDWVFDQHFLAEWQRILPTAEVHRFPDAGHLVLEDKPDEIQSLVKQFFARHPNQQ